MPTTVLGSTDVTVNKADTDSPSSHGPYTLVKNTNINKQLQSNSQKATVSTGALHGTCQGQAQYMLLSTPQLQIVYPVKFPCVKFIHPREEER